MLLRLLKIALIAAVALWGLVGAAHNLLDWSGTLGAVRAATAMTTFDGGPASWQATASPLLVWAGALFILGGKLAAAVLCGLGCVAMARARHADAGTFQAAKHLGLAGCAAALLMLFTGFVVIAESGFELWRSDALRGPVLDSAFRYAGCIALLAIFTGQRDG